MNNKYNAIFGQIKDDALEAQSAKIVELEEKLLAKDKEIERLKEGKNYGTVTKTSSNLSSHRNCLYYCSSRGFST